MRRLARVYLAAGQGRHRIRDPGGPVYFPLLLVSVPAGLFKVTGCSHMALRVPSAISIVLLCSFAGVAHAQRPTAATDSLQQALAQITARLDSLEGGNCPSGPAVILPQAPPGDPRTDSLTVALAQINQRLERVVTSRCTVAAVPAADSAGDDLAALRAAAAEASGNPPAAAGDTTAAKPTEFVGRQRNASAMNPEISATGNVEFRFPQDQAVQVVPREFELAFQASLDPYSAAKIFVSLEDGEVGIEEGYMYWTGLPAHLRVDAGVFRQEVGDLNRWHLHALPESEYPLVYRSYLNPDGLGGVGLSLYTVLPFSVAHGTHEAWLQGTSVSSDPLYAGERRPTLLGRFKNFWQLSRSTYVQLGFTGLGGSAPVDTLSSRVLGLDFRLTWRPPNVGTRQDLTLRAEGYQFHANELGVTTDRYGMYTDINYKASRRWVFGLRYDYVQAPRGHYSSVWGLTPTITWWQSEFVFLRLENAYRKDSILGSHNVALLQVVWALGPHKHETY
jgi:hypothetical protein